MRRGFAPATRAAEADSMSPDRYKLPPNSYWVFPRDLRDHDPARPHLTAMFAAATRGAAHAACGLDANPWELDASFFFLRRHVERDELVTARAGVT